ncbi:MAG: tRNA uridine-5-carboxymethylaminomethyl(34) synthesis GTPase MnmE [Acidobacteriia bacterium]|nr:tRNA uridine-5-carboxymethylaminomethyl(34) synthesis GTPase MnmE [Terriglobia bacterium]
MVDLSDTICALSSAPGRSGIAVVRLSGPRCFRILGQVFTPAHAHPEMPARRAVLGRILDPGTGGELDEALVTCFRSPHSYTGEDVAEMSTHGSPVVVAQLLELLCSEGARLAEPGEFTLRAFAHGRMDLAQAEAVRDVIEANTRYQLQVASRQRSGGLSQQLEPVRRQLTDVIVNLETAVEFVEQDLEVESRALLAAKLERILQELSRWVGSYQRGRIVRDGFGLAIIGRPNVGKSSLFNALLAEDRSIVTEMPGTTRDLVSEFVDIGGIAVRLVDTAGLRDGLDVIEQIGVDRSLRVMSDADALLVVVDTSRPWCREDERLQERLRPRSCLVALNKSDLPSMWAGPQREEYAALGPCVEVSALTGAGLDALRTAIQRHFFGDAGRGHDGLLVTNLRHCQCLEGARQQLAAAAGALRGGLSEEFVLADLHRGLQKLGEITGATSVEEVLGEIFSRFCIGK